MDPATFEAAIDAALGLAKEILTADGENKAERDNLLDVIKENGIEPTTFTLKVTLDQMGDNQISVATSIQRTAFKAKHTTEFPDPNQAKLDL